MKKCGEFQTEDVDESAARGGVDRGKRAGVAYKHLHSRHRGDDKIPIWRNSGWELRVTSWHGVNSELLKRRGTFSLLPGGRYMENESITQRKDRED